MKLADNFDAQWKENPLTGCWEWQRGFRSDGYGYMYIGGGRSEPSFMSTHRFSYERANGPIPEGMHVCHRCDNKACVNPQHLFLGTNTENRRDSVTKGRAARGETHGKRKINIESVRRIREMAKTGLQTQSQIAACFGISQTQASRIIRGARWAHV